METMWITSTSRQIRWSLPFLRDLDYVNHLNNRRISLLGIPSRPQSATWWWARTHQRQVPKLAARTSSRHAAIECRRWQHLRRTQAQITTTCSTLTPNRQVRTSLSYPCWATDLALSKQLGMLEAYSRIRSAVSKWLQTRSLRRTISFQVRLLQVSRPNRCKNQYKCRLQFWQIRKVLVWHAFTRPVKKYQRPKSQYQLVRARLQWPEVNTVPVHLAWLRTKVRASPSNTVVTRSQPHKWPPWSAQAFVSNNSSRCDTAWYLDDSFRIQIVNDVRKFKELVPVAFIPDPATLTQPESVYL